MTSFNWWFRGAYGLLKECLWSSQQKGFPSNNRKTVLTGLLLDPISPSFLSILGHLWGWSKPSSNSFRLRKPRLALLDDRISRSEHHTAEQSIQDQSGVDWRENLHETLGFYQSIWGPRFFPFRFWDSTGKTEPRGRASFVSLAAWGCHAFSKYGGYKGIDEDIIGYHRESRTCGVSETAGLPKLVNLGGPRFSVNLPFG